MEQINDAISKGATCTWAGTGWTGPARSWRPPCCPA